MKDPYRPLSSLEQASVLMSQYHGKRTQTIRTFLETVAGNCNHHYPLGIFSFSVSQTVSILTHSCQDMPRCATFCHAVKYRQHLTAFDGPPKPKIPNFFTNFDVQKRASSIPEDALLISLPVSQTQMSPPAQSQPPAGSLRSGSRRRPIDRFPQRP